MTLQEERDFYLYHYARFRAMSITKLEQVLGELWEKRYTEYDNSCVNEHRIAARAYLEKTRKGDSLVFHLKNYLG